MSTPAEKAPPSDAPLDTSSPPQNLQVNLVDLARDAAVSTALTMAPPVISDTARALLDKTGYGNATDQAKDATAPAARSDADGPKQEPTREQRRLAGAIMGVLTQEMRELHRQHPQRERSDEFYGQANKFQEAFLKEGGPDVKAIQDILSSYGGNDDALASFLHFAGSNFTESPMSLHNLYENGELTGIKINSDPKVYGEGQPIVAIYADGRPSEIVGHAYSSGDRQQYQIHRDGGLPGDPNAEAALRTIGNQTVSGLAKDSAEILRGLYWPN